MRLRRHDWAFVRPEAVCVVEADPEARGWVEAWRAQGRPLVITRQPRAPLHVALGAVLPRALGARRVACRVAGDALLRTRGPITVAEAAPRLPEREAVVLRELAATLAGCGARLGIYGSTAWDALAGGGYRHAQSDIDMICDVASSADVAPCVEALAHAASRSPVTLDGEIRIGDGAAVAWREVEAVLAGRTRSVLVKDLYIPRLMEWDVLAPALP